MESNKQPLEKSVRAANGGGETMAVDKDVKETGYVRISSSLQKFEYSKTSLLVPSTESKYVLSLLSEASDKDHKEWKVDDKDITGVVSLLTSSLNNGHVVSLPIPQRFPTTEYGVLKVLIEGENASFKSLIVEILDSRFDWEDSNSVRGRITYFSDDETQLEEMKTTLRKMAFRRQIKPEDNRTDYYVAMCRIDEEPLAYVCRWRNRVIQLTKQKIKEAKIASEGNERIIFSYLDSVCGYKNGA